MRYLRRETVHILENRKIIIPECIRRISNFNSTTEQPVYVAIANRSSITIKANIIKANANVKQLGILEIPAKIIKSANMLSVCIVTLYLIDMDTIEITSTHTNTDIENAEKSIIANPRITDENFIIENPREIIKVRFSDIYYFEKIKGTHNTCVVFVNGVSAFKSDLQEVLDKLDIGFIQCHKAFIANMTRLVKIETIQSSYILNFDNGQNCPCSMFYRKGVLEWEF